MPGKIKAPIDPKTTRRRVPWTEYVRNGALYATYRVVGTEGVGADLDRPRDVVLEKRPEFCRRKGEMG